MRMQNARDSFGWLELATWRIPRDQQYLFLLSHIRSYSSVLAHILGNSPEIDGCGETLLKYRRKRDLWRLRHRVRHYTGKPLHGRWLLDKILHNQIRSPEALTGSDQARTIIFLRAPANALRSMVTLAHLDPNKGRLRCPQAACDYYVTRLHRLRTDAERLGKRAIYFDAEALLSTPQLILSALSEWLGLATPLSPEYRVCKSTGTWGFGDPLRNIRAGRLVGAEQSTIASNASIPTPALAEAEAAYWRCKHTLVRHCESIRGGIVVTDAASTPAIGPAAVQMTGVGF